MRLKIALLFLITVCLAVAQEALSVRHLAQARDYALTGGGSGLVLHNGQPVFEWGDQAKLYDLKSTSKSIGVTALGLAIGDGKLSLDSMAADCLPELVTKTPDSDPKWLNRITLFHLATQTAGFEKRGGYSPLLFEPGTQWSYSDAGPNWLADCLTNTYHRDLEELLFERIFTKIGVKRGDLRWRENQYRPHQLGGVPRREAGSGVHANVGAMARIGLLYLNGGRFKGEQLLPESFVRQAVDSQPEVVDLRAYRPEEYGDAPKHYGLLWWNNVDGAIKGVPRDAYWSWGLYDSLIVVIPSLDIVVARAGRSFEHEAEEWSRYGKLEPFLRPIVDAVGAPYPKSDLAIDWAPQDSIVRLAEGSDNWPMTWGDDDALYTAYGDGWGFEPRVEEKLSLGFAKVSGEPTAPHGINVRSKSGERIGQGPRGVKASGMLMVDGTLYMLVRNASNSQLAWSNDHGESWTWADWRFETSFGAPTFLNFGKNYSGARDNYVYIYSQDDASAYLTADRAVLARVPKANLREQTAYEYYFGGSPPRWSKNVANRAAVFVNPGRVYRSGVSYNAGIKRYVWCQIIGGGDTRFEGGFGVYDAPKPWGPWTTLFYTDRWDVGPGETCSFPTKWMSEGGDAMYMVFSGDDYFSVRRADLTSSR